MALKIRIPKNLSMIIDVQRQDTGTVVKLNPNIWMVFGKMPNNHSLYGYQLFDPNTNSGSSFTGNLTENQMTRLINKIIKQPGFGFGKEQENYKKIINKLIKKIKTTYEQKV